MVSIFIILNLLEEGILMRNNAAYQKYLDKGYFQVKELIIKTTPSPKAVIKTYVTGKGQIFIEKSVRKALLNA